MEYIPSFRDDLHADIQPSFIKHGFRDENDVMYGLPKVKKFPMPDAKHVRSAIKFFNYAKPSQEQELANAILARMDDYGIDPNDINVGDDNRFKKYLQHSYLAHHGIKGMHWGIRRYQNPDGSLTSKGKQRYSLNPVKRMQQKKQAKDNARKERLASNCEQTSKRYARYSGKFKKAADTLEREGTHGKSIYMKRMNEGDWSDVYDHGPSHRQALKNAVQELRDCERQTSQWGKAYSDAAKYLRSNPGVSYKDATNYINRSIYDKAEKKYGYDKIDDYSYIIDENGIDYAR